MASRLSLCAMLAALCLPAVAGAELWRYQTESGSVSFTDDFKRIPSRYAADAVQIEERSLADYERTTISEPGASIESTKTILDLDDLEARLAAALGTPASGSTPGQGGGPAPVSISVADGIRLDIAADSDEPISVDKGQYMSRNGVLSPHTVVSRGGKPLIIIDERP